jgi:hypothetical protein
VDTKFGSAWGGWSSIDLPMPQGVGLWKNIRMGWRLFFRHTSFEMGDGFKIKFWDDVWCGEMTLKEAFPDLYNFTRVKDVYVVVNLDFSNGMLTFYPCGSRLGGGCIGFLLLCYIPIEGEGKGKTSFSGPLLTKESLMLALFTRTLLVIMFFLSL